MNKLTKLPEDELTEKQKDEIAILDSETEMLNEMVEEIGVVNTEKVRLIIARRIRRILDIRESQQEETLKLIKEFILSHATATGLEHGEEIVFAKFKKSGLLILGNIEGRKK